MNIRQYNSPNHYDGRKGWKPDIIVDHITGGTFTSAINTFMNKSCEVSSHFIVSKAGEIAQMVDLRNGAWCNGTSTSGDKRDYRKATNPLVRSRNANANYYTISIEHENMGGGNLTPAQLSATIELHKYIIEQVKSIYGTDIQADRQHIIGHYEINPITRPACPGASFPFDKIILGIGSASAKQSTSETLYTVKSGDSFWKIAQQQMGSGLKVAALAAYNGLSTASVIKPGQILKIPK